MDSIIGRPVTIRALHSLSNTLDGMNRVINYLVIAGLPAVTV